MSTYPRWLRTMAEIFLIIVLLPFVCLILGTLFNSIDGYTDVLEAIMESIPFFELWFMLLFKTGLGVTGKMVMESTAYIFFSEFVKAMVLGVTMHASDTVFKLANGPKTGIFAKFIGIFAGTFLIGVFSKLGSSAAAVIAEIVTIVIIIIAIRIMVTSRIPGALIFGPKRILLIMASGVVAVTLCGYLVAITALARYGSDAMPVQSVLKISICAVLSAIILTIVDNAVNNDTDGL